jgi:hypothetical protein
VAAFDLFTNADKSESELDVKSPAFSLTKVGTTYGSLLSVVTGGLPAALQANETIRIAAFAAATVVMLGVFALGAVDIIVRQRAAEATLRYSGKGHDDDNESAPKRFVAFADSSELKLQVGSNTEEYDLYAAEVNGGDVTLHAKKNGAPHTESFTLPRRR